MDLRAMNSGVSGLLAEQQALGVVGDNIANVNTVGFKAQRAIFEDVLGHSILAGTSSSLPGSGVAIGDIQQQFTQGSLNTTGISTDVALSGDGFFVVKGAVDGVSGNFYSRAGQFNLDKDGYLANSNGNTIQTLNAGAKSAGIAQITWDGRSSSGTVEPAGTYSVSVSATSAAGGAVSVSQNLTGNVQSVSFSSGSAVINLDNGVSAPASQLLQVQAATSNASTSTSK